MQYLMVRLIVIYLLALVVGCKSQKVATELPVKIVREEMYVCQIFNGHKKIGGFPLLPAQTNPQTGYYKYSGLVWLTDTTLVANQKFYSLNPTSSNIVIINEKGIVKEKITSDDALTYSSGCYPSNDGTRFLFTTILHPKSQKADNDSIKILRSLIPEKTIKVLDFVKKDTVKITNFIKGGDLHFDESPWSPNSQQFVYTVTKLPILTLNGKTLDGAALKTSNSSYIYDINEKCNKKNILGSKCAVWHPIKNIIAYVADSAVLFYDVERNIHSKFTISKKEADIFNIRWVPNTEYLYVQFTINGRLEEKFYRLQDGVEVDFLKPRIGTRFFSWR